MNVTQSIAYKEKLQKGNFLYKVSKQSNGSSGDVQMYDQSNLQRETQMYNAKNIQIFQTDIAMRFR